MLQTKESIDDLLSAIIDFYSACLYLVMLENDNKIGSMIAGGLSAVKNWVVPPLCLMCERIVDTSGVCCPSCWKTIRFISKPYCEVLGTPFSHDLGEGMLSANAIASPPAFARARSAVLYDENMRRLVSSFKYSDQTELGPWMANWMVRAGSELLAQEPVLIPVPLHSRRLISRRYNQSAELVRHIAGETECEFQCDVLERIKNTKQQVGLSSKERERNVMGAFRVKKDNAYRIKGKSILLVDDVFTTGATVNAAAKALKRAGVQSVDVLTFARVEIFDI